MTTIVSLKNSLILCFILLCFSQNNFAQQQHRRIKLSHISQKDGLSQSTIHCILQDSKGFMWFGTLDGLNKYDGYKITEYRKNPSNSKSIADNAINTIFEDSKGSLWIGTQSAGLCMYDKITDEFTNYQHLQNDANSISNNNVTSITEDRKGNLWIGTGNGLNKFNLKTKKSISYKYIEGQKHCLSNNHINALQMEKSGVLWIGTDNGLNKYEFAKDKFSAYQNIADTIETSNPDKVANKIRTLFLDSDGNLWLGTNNGLTKRDKMWRNFTTYINNPDDSYSLSDNIINTIIEDTSGVLWIGTQNGGLNEFRKETGKFYSYTHDPSDQNSLSTNNVQFLFQDKARILWIGTALAGINKWNRAAENLNVFRHNPYDVNSLSSNQVRTIYQDKDSILWVGTVDGGLNKWNKEEAKFIRYKKGRNSSTGLSNNHVRSILEDSKGNFWICTDGGGLNKFNRKDETFKQYRHNKENPNTLSSDVLWKIIETKDGLLWIATNGGGLNIFNPDNKKFTAYRHDPKNTESISSDNITTILEDKDGTIWIGTYGSGLNKWNADSKSFTHYKNDPTNIKSLGNDRIYSITEDKDGIIWIGSKGCLNRFDKKTEVFKRYDEADGLPNNVIMGIIEADNGHLWISTNKGLSKFNKEKETFRNYDVRDGLQGNEFLVGSFCKSIDGELFFGGINGFNAFYPDKILDNVNIPPIVITGFQVHNQELKLDTNIIEKYSITLEYNQNFLSFDFVALDYIFPEKNQYQYMLEGLDKKWNPSKNRRFATYPKLDPKKYIFRVKGSNNDGIWNEEGISLIVIIKPAFWQTTWFKILIFGMILMAAFMFVRMRIKNIEANKELLEKQVRERTAQVVKQKEEIETQRDEIEANRDEIEANRDEVREQRDIANSQKDMITEQKQEITDSIRYAKRIQTATLPIDIGMGEDIESFVLFKPKDIVSGDFYWSGSIDDKLIIIAADCTGHGVPGAFMSMLGISFLNKIVAEKGISNPHEILNRLRENVIKSLHQKGAEMEAKDGMDIALCTFDLKNRKLQFAGANNPLYLVRNKETTIIKGDKMPIAIFDNMDSFATHDVELKKDDVIYIFSDGYADQFGGPRQKKFKYKPFREMLEHNSDLPMDEQRDILNRTIEEWKGNTEQIDDVIVIGIKIP